MVGDGDVLGRTGAAHRDVAEVDACRRHRNLRRAGAQAAAARQ